MEYYFIHKLFCDIFDKKIKRCKNCNKIILKEPFLYKENFLCSYKCLKKFYENDYK